LQSGCDCVSARTRVSVPSSLSPPRQPSAGRRARRSPGRRARGSRARHDTEMAQLVAGRRRNCVRRRTNGSVSNCAAPGAEERPWTCTTGP
jgi:hypothetical protein